MGNSPMQPRDLVRFTDLGYTEVLGELFTTDIFNYHSVSIEDLRDDVFKFISKDTNVRRNTEIKR